MSEPGLQKLGKSFLEGQRATFTAFPRRMAMHRTDSGKEELPQAMGQMEHPVGAMRSDSLTFNFLGQSLLMPIGGGKIGVQRQRAAVKFERARLVAILLQHVGQV